MKKTFKMKDLDCANCAAKMENAIKRIEGVQNAQISFMTQKITLEAPEELFEKILQDAMKICKKIEPDCVIITK
ncbi:cation transporter [Anaerovorax sp. IOR16]|uniref:cation transporter n=1 Tax=Anaerovorax sp. IOR16 TaxID=2773458 RepID=UPI0019D1B810|nr:cation transporter [Anaerovorax sp. IOR16]